MTFSEATQHLPAAVRLWILWLTIVMIAAPVILLFFKQTRLDALVILVANIAVAISMNLLYSMVGMVRLLGLAHIIIWTPLAIYIFIRIKNRPLPSIARAVLAVLLLSIGISLVFDYLDVALFILGERAPLVEVPPSAG